MQIYNKYKHGELEKNGPQSKINFENSKKLYNTTKIILNIVKVK
jgi:hypothetical protein